MGKRPFLEMAAGFICGISIAVYGKPWTLWLLFFGILLWPAIVTGHDRGMPESDRYPVRKRRWCMAVCSAAALFLGWHHCGVVQAEQNQYLPYLDCLLYTSGIRKAGRTDRCKGTGGRTDCDHGRFRRTPFCTTAHHRETTCG